MQSCDPRCAGSGVSAGRVPCAPASPLRPWAWRYSGVRAEAGLCPCRPVPHGRLAATPLPAPLVPLCPPGAEPLGRINARSALPACGAEPGGTAGLRGSRAGSSEPLCPGRARRAAERPPVPASRTAFCGRAAGCRFPPCGPAGPACRKGELRQPGKGECQAPGCGAERSVPLPGSPRQRWPGQCAARGARGEQRVPAAAAAPQAWPGRGMSRTRCEPGLPRRPHPALSPGPGQGPACGDGQG